MPLEWYHDTEHLHKFALEEDQPARLVRPPWRTGVLKAQTATETAQ